MRIAIDVTGGDNAPDAILDGAIQARELLGPDDQIVLLGDEAVIRESLQEAGVGRDPRFTIEPTSQTIGMDETPVDALRDKPDSSIARLGWLGSKRAGDQRVEIVISAGNTGAMVASAQMSMRRLPGVHRPGIAVTMPTFHGPVVLCDVGANIVPKPHHLHQYGHMASLFAHEVIGIEDPRVCLLSVGGEETKGTGLVKDTNKLMRCDPSINYHGYIEGRGLFDGQADVIVTEGFTGNVVLKLAEGLAAGLFRTIAHEIFEEDPNMAMQFEPVVKKIYAKHDWHEFGGAPLLGVNGNCIICHGSSEARTIRSAVRNAVAYMNHQVNEKIVERLAEAQKAVGEVDV